MLTITNAHPSRSRSYTDTYSYERKYITPYVYECFRKFEPKTLKVDEVAIGTSLSMNILFITKEIVQLNY